MSNVTIIKGEQKKYSIRLTDKNGAPFDLTTYDLQKVCIRTAQGEVSITETPNPNGSVVNIIGDPVLGELEVLMQPADTNALNEGSRQTIDVEIDISSTPSPRRSKLEEVLTVKGFACN